MHGKYHRASGKQLPIDGIRDVLECRTELENDFGMIIRGMAYPDSGITRFENGAEYGNIKRYLTDLGIVYSRTLGGDNDSFALPTDWHAWMPTAHHTNPELFGYIDKFLNEPMSSYDAAQTPGLFYLWGHSFEFENNKNGICLIKYALPFQISPMYGMLRILRFTIMFPLTAHLFSAPMAVWSIIRRS